MKQKYHLISSIISMCITCLLLIFIIFAWYTQNDTVTASGISGSSANMEIESDGVVAGIKYYEIIMIDDNNRYYYDPTMGNETINDLELGSYDALYGNPYQVLIELTLKESDLNISASIDASKILHDKLKDNTGFIYQGAIDPETNRPIVEVTHDQNQLSSIICFYYFDSVNNGTGDNADMSYVEVTQSNEQKSFVNQTKDGFDKYLNSSVTIQSGTGTVDSTTNTKTVYILFSYVEEAIEDIYSVNLGSDALNPDDSQEETDPEHWDDIAYVCDFKLVIA